MSDSRTKHAGTAAFDCPAEQSSAVVSHEDAAPHGHRYLDELRHAASQLVSALREIFDESAYARFLAKREMNSCASAYSEFLCEQESIKARRPRCC